MTARLIELANDLPAPGPVERPVKERLEMLPAIPRLADVAARFKGSAVALRDGANALRGAA